MPKTNGALLSEAWETLGRVPDTTENASIREEIQEMTRSLNRLPADAEANEVDIQKVAGWESLFPTTPTARPDTDHGAHTEREEPESLAVRTEEQPRPDPERQEDPPSPTRHHHAWFVLTSALVAIALVVCVYFLNKEVHTSKSVAQSRENSTAEKAKATQATADSAQATAKANQGTIADIKADVTAVKTSLDTLKERVESLRDTHEEDMGMVNERLNVKETLDVGQGERLADLQDQLYQHDTDIRQLRDFREEAHVWRDSIAGRLPTAQGNNKRVAAPVAPVVPKVETTQVVATSTGPTVAVTLRNKILNAKVRLAYEGWNRVLSPNGKIVLNLPPGEVILLVVTNLQSGDGWVIPINAANQRQQEVTIPPKE